MLWYYKYRWEAQVREKDPESPSTQWLLGPESLNSGYLDSLGEAVNQALEAEAAMMKLDYEAKISKLEAEEAA